MKEVVYDLSPEAVAKFAIVEELRLIQSKLDRMQAFWEAQAISESRILEQLNLMEKARELYQNELDYLLKKKKYKLRKKHDNRKKR